MNKLKYFQLVTIGLAIVATYYRWKQEDSQVLMTFITVISIIITLINIIFLISHKLEEKEKKFKWNEDIVKRYNMGMLCVSPFIIAGILIYYCENASSYWNDIATIWSLAVAISADIITDIILAIIYKPKNPHKVRID
ncbi:hypothetical protein PBV87_21370 [Niameybacter massiliensis]|uniref:Uncharacterized protein n=1 Tax=Holtiella tumoricola TaxID=3018743 RepID=A0AA42J3L8_9FIRM|nr:hypothetical protein [Holtiella tumoricola]MDA3734028.1 hypothetical protein [Holtiella tumoricola]